MKSGRLLYSRCDGHQVEMVYVDNAASVLKVMTWQETVEFATKLLNHAAEIRAKEMPVDKSTG